MNWSDVIADRSLQDLPYRIELNGYGQIVMTPISNRHGMTLSQVANALFDCSDDGQVYITCSMATRDGVKVPDAAWLSNSTWHQQRENTPFERAPELCVEVLSPSNSREEMAEKMQLYFERGAQEVWLCTEAGEVEFHAPAQQLKASLLFPDFPTTIR